MSSRKIKILLMLILDQREHRAETERKKRRRHGGGAATTVVAATDPASTTYVSDTFNRANQHLSGSTPDTGAAWSDTSDFTRVLSNRSSSASGAALRIATIDSNSGGTYFQAADGKIRAIMPVLGQAGLIARYASNSSCIYLEIAGAVPTLYRITGGTLNAIASDDTTISAGSEIRLDLSGSSISFYRDGTLVFTVTETQGQTLTKHGIAFADTTARLDTYSHKNA